MHHLALCHSLGKNPKLLDGTHTLVLFAQSAIKPYISSASIMAKFAHLWQEHCLICAMFAIVHWGIEDYGKVCSFMARTLPYLCNVCHSALGHRRLWQSLLVYGKNLALFVQCLP
jgi:hypothetical protein